MSGHLPTDGLEGRTLDVLHRLMLEAMPPDHADSLAVRVGMAEGREAPDHVPTVLVGRGSGAFVRLLVRYLQDAAVPTRLVAWSDVAGWMDAHSIPEVVGLMGPPDVVVPGLRWLDVVDRAHVFVGARRERGMCLPDGGALALVLRFHLPARRAAAVAHHVDALEAAR